LETPQQYVDLGERVGHVNGLGPELIKSLADGVSGVLTAMVRRQGNAPN
jgi:hypothetical protein